MPRPERSSSLFGKSRFLSSGVFTLVFLLFAATLNAETPGTGTLPQGIVEDHVRWYQGFKALVESSTAVTEPESVQTVAVETEGGDSRSTVVAETDRLLERLQGLDSSGMNEVARMRLIYMMGQLRAAQCWLEVQSGTHISFNELSQRYYGVDLPPFDEAAFEQSMQVIASELPGEGSLIDRYNAFVSQFQVPADKVETLGHTVIAEARKRCLSHLLLPQGERFELKVESGLYGGTAQPIDALLTRITINRDIPFAIEMLHGLLVHEGYPGHHVHFLFLQRELRGEPAYPEQKWHFVFGPDMVILEGVAEMAIDMIYTPEEKMRYEIETLFPLVGLDSAEAERYYRIQEHYNRWFLPSLVEAARKMHNAELAADEVVGWLETHTLSHRPKAEALLYMAQGLGLYLSSYAAGKHLVKGFIERNGGSPDNPALRWNLFEFILSNPVSPEYLASLSFETVPTSTPLIPTAP